MISINIEVDSKEEIIAFKKSLEFSNEVIVFEKIEVKGSKYVTQGRVKSMPFYTDIENFLYIIKSFNEKVDKLLYLSFIQELHKQGNTAKIKSSK